MADEVLDIVAQNIRDVGEKIDRAQKLLAIAKEAGEDVVEFEQQLQSLRVRKAKWENVLKNQGVIV